MKILHVIPILGCGGAEILVGKIALHQKKLGHEVEIVTLYPQHPTFHHYPDREKLEKEIPITVVTSRVKLLQRTKKQLLFEWQKILFRFSPEVIHAHLYEADLLAHSIIFPNVVYITHVHGPVIPLETKKKFLFSKKEIYELLEKRWLHKKYTESNTHFIAISKATSDYTKTIIPSSLHDNIQIILNAIEVEKYSFHQRNHLQQPIKFITTGNLVAKKNHAFIIRTIKFLVDSGYDCELEILGYGILENDLHNLAALLSLENKIHFQGSVGNVAERLLKADIYLHAAIPEPFGLAILEAMATGLPCVTIDGGGNRDFIEDGKNGFIVSELNVQLFAEKINALIDDSSLYATIGSNARTTALKFDFTSFSNSILNYYSQIST